MNLATSLDEALALVGALADVIHGRVEEPVAPAWCTARTWSEWLLALDEPALERAELEGLEGLEALATHSAALAPPPTSLLALAAAVRRLTTLPPLDGPRPSAQAFHAVAPRKRAQLGALEAICRELARGAARVVDVGAGRGHFTRLATSAFGKPTLGIERDALRVERARALGRGLPARFEVRDVAPGASDALLAPSDLAVGLHACGELGDALVAAAIRAPAALVLVACCPQKIRGSERQALSERARGRFTIARAALGLCNLMPRAEGVETGHQTSLDARMRRYALRRLLRARGLTLAAGDEMHGLNRRRARLPFAELARAALVARALAPASAAELALHERAAESEFGAIRRLSLPRALCGRLIEVTLALDRACALAEQGFDVELGTLCDAGVTPRNVAIVATPVGWGAHAEHTPAAK